jgi:hypothetical protein
MNTLERIKRLCDHYALPLEIVQGRLHSLLDCIDTAAGMDTRGATCHCFFKAEGIPINQVGTRLWRHERHIDGAYPYHHLGEAALTS